MKRFSGLLASSDSMVVSVLRCYDRLTAFGSMLLSGREAHSLQYSHLQQRAAAKTETKEKCAASLPPFKELSFLLGLTLTPSRFSVRRFAEQYTLPSMFSPISLHVCSDLRLAGNTSRQIQWNCREMDPIFNEFDLTLQSCNQQV